MKHRNSAFYESVLLVEVDGNFNFTCFTCYL